MSTNESQLKSSGTLIELYESMDDERKRSLCDFADFLYARAEPISKEIPAPEDVPRPQQETVVGAVKRLKGKYHMVESMAVFSAASSLMTDHMVKGRDVVEVIDEMEVLFAEAYEKLLQANGSSDDDSQDDASSDDVAQDSQ
jgi:hypothetical protein